MASRSQLVVGWRMRLAENQRLLTQSSASRRWIRRVYVRLYRFLISCYGGEDWRGGEQQEGTAAAPPGRMEFVDHTVGAAGLQPKSTERIRATLDAVRAACDTSAVSGDLAEGLRPEDWIAVASESGHVSPYRCVRMLKRHGIAARRAYRGDDVIVEVQAAQRSEGLKLVEDRKSDVRSVPADRWRSHPLMIPLRGGVMGALLGFQVGMLLVAILDKLYDLRSYPTGGSTMLAAFAFGLFGSIVIGVVVAMWWDKESR